MNTATKTRRTSKLQSRKGHKLSQEEREQRIRDAKERLDAAVENLLTAEGWRALIASRRWLRKYSLNNLLMILHQCPTASDVRPLSAWNEVGRRVIKGSKAIRIFAPMIRKTEVVVESDNVSDESEIQEREKLVGFRLVPVFDVSQTEGEPLPEPVSLDAPQLEGDAPAGLWDSLVAECVREGYPVEIGDAKGADGYTSPAEKKIVIQKGMSPAHQVHTLAHELAHVLMKHFGRYATERDACEVEAESVACIVAAVAGLDASVNSVPYVAGWAGDAKTVKDAAQRVLSTADEIIKRLDLGA